MNIYRLYAVLLGSSIASCATPPATVQPVSSVPPVSSSAQAGPAVSTMTEVPYLGTKPLTASEDLSYLLHGYDSFTHQMKDTKCVKYKDSLQLPPIPDMPDIDRILKSTQGVTRQELEEQLNMSSAA